MPIAHNCCFLQMGADLVASIHTMESSLAQLTAATSENMGASDATLEVGLLRKDQNNWHSRDAIWELDKDRGTRIPAASDLFNLESQNNTAAPSKSEHNCGKAVPERAGFSGREVDEWAGFRVGDRCRFKGRDGRWHNGIVLEFQGSQSANGAPSRRSKMRVLVGYLTPTTAQTKLCSFFAQRRCRFGADCR